MSVWCVGGCGVLGDPVWCADCATVVRGALRRLPVGYVALGDLMGGEGLAVSFDARVSGSRPCRSVSPVVDLRDELFRGVCGWEVAVRECLGLGLGGVSGSREVVLTGSVEFLNRCFGSVMSGADAECFGLWVWRVFDRVLSVVRNGPSRSLLSLPCPFCRMRCLVQHDGVANVSWYTVCEKRMGGCGRLFTESEVDCMVEQAIRA